MNIVRKYSGIVILMFFLASLTEADLQEGLVMYLPFDEGQGEIVGDLSGNGHDGTIQGAEWTNGQSGKALSFNGVDSFVEVPFSEDFVITEAITLSAWVTANVSFSPEWRGIINARKSTYGPFLLHTGGAVKGRNRTVSSGSMDMAAHRRVSGARSVPRPTCRVVGYSAGN